MANYQYNPPLNQGAPGSTNIASGGAQVLSFRNPQDSLRTPVGQQVPYAQYPDGYLGTINSRREDRLLDAVKERANQRPYQRGVHKGERIPLSDYFWPDELQPDTALQAESIGMRWTQRGDVTQRLVYGGKNLTTPEELGQMAQQMGLRNPGKEPLDPQRLERLRGMTPGWR